MQAAPPPLLEQWAADPPVRRVEYDDPAWEKSDLPFDAWIPERTFDNVSWHVTGLPPGEHTVRVVVTGHSDERATGSVVQIQAAVVYGAGSTPRP